MINNIIEENCDLEEKCELCGNEIGEFCDNGIYEGKYCEECFIEAQESRL